MYIFVYFLVGFLLVLRIMNYLYAYTIYKTIKDTEDNICNPFFNVKKFYMQVKDSKRSEEFNIFILLYRVEEYLIYITLIIFLLAIGGIEALIVIFFLLFILIDKKILKIAKKNKLNLKTPITSGELIEYYEFLIKDGKNYKYLSKIILLKFFFLFLSIILFICVVFMNQ